MLESHKGAYHPCLYARARHVVTFSLATAPEIFTTLPSAYAPPRRTLPPPQVPPPLLPPLHSHRRLLLSSNYKLRPPSFPFGTESPILLWQRMSSPLWCLFVFVHVLNRRVFNENSACGISRTAILSPSRTTNMTTLTKSPSLYYPQRPSPSSL